MAETDTVVGNEEETGTAPEEETGTAPEEETEHEEEEETEPEPEPAPETPPAASEADIEKAFAQLDKEAARHTSRVAQIMGDDALELEVCPRCHPSVPGFTFKGAPVDDDQKRAVLVSIGELGELDYKPAPHARTCDTCDGLGLMFSGSKVAGQTLVQCPTCLNGRGWLGEAPANSPAPVAGAEGVAPEAVAVTEPESDLDPWGRRPTDPHYGVMPQYVR